MADVVRELETASPPVSARWAARLPELAEFTVRNPILAHSALWFFRLVRSRNELTLTSSTNKSTHGSACHGNECDRSRSIDRTA